MSSPQHTEASDTPSDTFFDFDSPDGSPDTLLSTDEESVDDTDDALDDDEEDSALLGFGRSSRKVEDALVYSLGNNLYLAAQLLPHLRQTFQAQVSKHQQDTVSLLGRYNSLDVPSARDVRHESCTFSELGGNCLGVDGDATARTSRPAGQYKNRSLNDKQLSLSDENSGTQSHVGVISNQTSNLQKRGQSPDEPDEPRGSRPNKRTKYGASKGCRTFACHFSKHSPRKYGIWTDAKYRICPCPMVPETRLDRIL